MAQQNDTTNLGGMLSRFMGWKQRFPARQALKSIREAKRTQVTGRI